MIESLAEHGVLAGDLTPSLMATHTIANPEYDPQEAARVERERALEEEKAREEAERLAEEERVAEEARLESEALRVEENGHDELARVDDEGESPAAATPSPSFVKRSLPSINADPSDLAFGQASPPRSSSPLPSLSSPRPVSPPPPPPYSQRSRSISTPNPFGDDDAEEDGGDIGRFDSDEEDLRSTPKPPHLDLPPAEESVEEEEEPPKIVGTTTDLEKPLRKEDENATPLLPGVSTTVTAADEDITLDIRWTILCDLFLLLIADSVYDARSRVLLERAATKLSLGTIDVVRFEKRVTESLEIQEGVERLKQEEVIEGRAQTSKKKRYVAIGLATLGASLFSSSCSLTAVDRHRLAPSPLRRRWSRHWPLGWPARARHRRCPRRRAHDGRHHRHSGLPRRRGRCGRHHDRRCRCWLDHRQAVDVAAHARRYDVRAQGAPQPEARQRVDHDARVRRPSASGPALAASCPC